MEITQEKLSNGLNTLLINQPSSTAASVQIWFRAGSALEQHGDEGIAHFLEHMFFKGSKKRPGAMIAKDVESFGGEVNAFTSFDYTCYYINCPADKILDSSEIIMDMVSNPLFDMDELIPERGVVFEEYRRSQDSPHQYHFQRIQNSSFTKGYSHPILGFEKTIKNFSQEQLHRFRKNHYNLSNSMLVIAGDLKKTPVKKLKENISSFSIPEGPKSEFYDFKLKAKPEINIYEKDVRMVTTTIIIEAPNYESEEGVAEDLALNVLGYGESSLLYQDLVIKNSLCNVANGSTMFLSKGGVHFIKFTCPLENFTKACNEMISCLKNISLNGVDPKQVGKIQKQYISSKIYEKESLETFSFSLGHGFAQNGDIHCEDHFIEALRSCTAFDVNKALKRIFGRNLHISIQTPRGVNPKKIQPSCKKLITEISKLKFNASNNNLKIIAQSKFDPETKVIKIKEGVQLIHRQNKITPTFNFYCYLKGGITDETTKDNGIHQLLTSLLVKGSKSYPYEKMKLTLDHLSSSITSFAGKNAYGLQMHGLSDHSEELFNVFFSSLLDPKFETKFLTHEKKLLLRALENHKEDPTKQCFRLVNQSFFKSHPYSLSVLGNENSLRKIKRLDIVQKHRKNLDKKEIVFNYSGSLPLEQVVGLIEKHLEKIKARKPKKGLPKNISKNTKTNIHLEFDREQTQVFIGMPGLSIKSKQDVQLKMLTTYLSGLSSELFVDVRDKQGLCYVVQPVHFSALEAGYWGIYMASGHDKTQKAIDAINKILDRLATKGFTKNQLETIKQMVHGQNLLHIQTNDDYAQLYSIPVLHGLGLDFQHKVLDSISKTELAEFNNFIKKFLSKKRTLITVGKSY